MSVNTQQYRNVPDLEVAPITSASCTVADPSAETMLGMYPEVVKSTINAISSLYPNNSDEIRTQIQKEFERLNNCVAALCRTMVTSSSTQFLDPITISKRVNSLLENECNRDAFFTDSDGTNHMGRYFSLFANGGNGRDGQIDQYVRQNLHYDMTRAINKAIGDSKLPVIDRACARKLRIVRADFIKGVNSVVELLSSMYKMGFRTTDRQSVRVGDFDNHRRHLKSHVDMNDAQIDRSLNMSFDRQSPLYTPACYSAMLGKYVASFRVSQSIGGAESSIVDAYPVPLAVMLDYTQTFAMIMSDFGFMYRENKNVAKIGGTKRDVYKLVPTKIMLPGQDQPSETSFDNTFKELRSQFRGNRQLLPKIEELYAEMLRVYTSVYDLYKTSSSASSNKVIFTLHTSAVQTTTPLEVGPQVQVHSDSTTIDASHIAVGISEYNILVDLFHNSEKRAMSPEAAIDSISDANNRVEILHLTSDTTDKRKVYQQLKELYDQINSTINLSIVLTGVSMFAGRLRAANPEIYSLCSWNPLIAPATIDYLEDVSYGENGSEHNKYVARLTDQRNAYSNTLNEVVKTLSKVVKSK